MKKPKTSPPRQSNFMERILKNSELDTLCYNVCYSPFLYWKRTFDYFKDLYYTGCRSAEPLDISRWKLVNDKVILSTMKTEAIRFFEPSKLSGSLLRAITEGSIPYEGITYDQLTLEFRKVVGLHPIYAGKRIADTYLFRYNRARLLFDKTNSLNEVQDFFGWSNSDMAASYVTQPLIYKPAGKSGI